MGRVQNPTKMEIDLSLKIDTDDEQKAQADEQLKEYNQEEMAQIPDNNNKEEVPETTAGEIEDDASVVETSLQDNTKTKEVLVFSLSTTRSKIITSFLYLSTSLI